MKTGKCKLKNVGARNILHLPIFNFQFSISILLCAFVSLWFSSACPADERPNILVLLADDWRHDTLGCENPIVKTPHLDALAKEGVRYTQARVTTSICSVSRASIFTGQYMSRHGVDRFGQRVPDWSKAYPALLHDAGYHTGFVGKYGVGKIDRADFDFARAYEGTHWMKGERDERIHVTEKNLRDSLEFLKTRPADKPFCLSVSFFAAHAQDNTPEQYLPQPWSEKLYADAVIPIPKTATEEHFRALPPFLATDKNEGRVRWKKRFDTPEKYQTYMKNYYRLVSEADDAIGKIVAELRAQGVYDSTFILFTADNGYFHGEHGLADKWYPYEEALRVPMIVRDPQDDTSTRDPTPRGRVSSAMVLNIDVAPTLLRAAGLDPPATMQGEPLQLYRSAVTRAPRWRKQFYYEHPVILGKDRIPRSEALIWNQWRYIYWPDYDYEELYDLADDPHQERKDGKEKKPELLTDLRQELKSWRDKVK